MGMGAMMMQAGGGFIKTIADEQANQTNMLIAMRNQYIEAAKATDVYERGQTMASRKLGEGTQRGGMIAARAAGSGVDVSASGSVRDVQESSKGVNALDVATIRNNAAKEVFGHEVAAQDWGIKADVAKTQSMLDPFANVLGASSQMSVTGYQTDVTDNPWGGVKPPTIGDTDYAAG